MKKVVVLLLIGVVAVVNIASADTFGTGANQFTIDFVDISGDTNPASGYGIVNSDYRMGTYEITNDQWNKFKVSYGTPTGSPLTAYDYDPYQGDNTEPYFTGTNFSVSYTSWYESAQFVNYLNTSTGHQAAYNFTGTQGQSDYSLETWESEDAGYDASNPYRNSNAYYFLPTEDEWVKAAYWNGTNLQTYATKASESLAQGNGTSGTGWNYYEGNFATNPFGAWAVGSGSQELNGTYDMMGNVWEWMENPYSDINYGTASNRGLRGGSYNDSDVSYFASPTRGSYNPSEETYGIGFRVASIPEPCSLILIGGGCLFIRGKK